MHMYILLIGIIYISTVFLTHIFATYRRRNIYLFTSQNVSPGAMAYGYNEKSS